ncbi:MAG TPA: hypothetical protein VGP19_13795 [Candidatus Acidoferrales bacterium]|jgi:hypothetical protein|nr:hypothetical protein [Candidatus Acidoferrales bacterium]
MDQVRTMTRVELYERVWTTPMQKLAIEFGLSDVGLAKLCRRHRVPVPGRGYWAKVQFGQNPKRVALPAPGHLALETITITPREKQPPSIDKPRDERPIPQIEVPQDRPITHRIVLQIDKSILRSNKDERGLPLAKQSRVLPVHVSLESIPRALLMLDALFVALDGAGYKIDWPSPYNSRLTVTALNEKIGLYMSEVVERKQHKMTQDDLSRQKVDRWWTPPRWDYRRTGRLKFALESIEASEIQHTWADGEKQKLESCVGEMLIGFETTANAVKKYREDCARAARERAEEQKRAAELRVREAEYNRKYEVVSKLAQAWGEANRLRQFAVALKENARSPVVPIEQKVGIHRILDWIERHANSIDPFTDAQQIIRQFDKPRWPWSY